MNMNNRLWTTLYEMDIRIHTVDVSHEADEVTYHENYLKQNLPNIFSTRKTYILMKILSVFVAAEYLNSVYLGVN